MVGFGVNNDQHASTINYQYNAGRRHRRGWELRPHWAAGGGLDHKL